MTSIGAKTGAEIGLTGANPATVVAGAVIGLVVGFAVGYWWGD